MNPSPRVSVSRSWRQHSGQGSCQHLAKKDLQSQVGSRADEVLRLAGQILQRPMPREISVAQSSTAVSAVVWSLPQLHLESGMLHPSGSFD